MKPRTITVRRQQFGWMMIAPALALLMVIGLYPYLMILYHSLHDWSLIHTVDRPDFVGLHNFGNAFGDHAFFKSILLTFKFLAVILPTEFVIGLIIALLLNHRRLMFRGILRSLMLLPMMLSPIVTAVVWKMIYSTQFGPLNYFLKIAGITDGRTEWIGSVQRAFPALAAATVWMWYPFSVLVLLAGLQSIPEEEYEAARIDGASFLQGFRFVTLPHLIPSIMVILLIRFIDGLKTFALVHALTGGGPGTSTELISYNIYKIAFRNFDIGYSSALAIILVVVTVAVSGVIVKSVRSLSRQ